MFVRCAALLFRNSAIQTAPPDLQASSIMAAFLGPTLVNADVYFSVRDLRKSGKTFLTKRVTSFQLLPGEDLDAAAARPANFEATVDFYRPPTELDADDLAFASPPSPFSSIVSVSDVLESSDDLDTVGAAVKSGEAERGPLYGMAVALARKLSESAMLMTIRIPKQQAHPKGSAKTAYWVGVDADLCANLRGENLGRVVLPYVCDGMTQVRGERERERERREERGEENKQHHPKEVVLGASLFPLSLIICGPSN